MATCEALLRRGQAVPEAIAGSFLRWYRAGALTGLGSSTLEALRGLDAGAHWALSGARGEMAAGNGAAMRIAPLAFVLDPFSPEDRVVVRDICRITHHSDESYVGALAVLLCLHLDPRQEELFRSIAATLPGSRVRDRLESFAELPSDRPLRLVAEEFGASGYVVETVPLVLYLACRMSQVSFSEGLQEATELSGDMDTICSIAGQVSG